MGLMERVYMSEQQSEGLRATDVRPVDASKSNIAKKQLITECSNVCNQPLLSQLEIGILEK